MRQDIQSILKGTLFENVEIGTHTESSFKEMMAVASCFFKMLLPRVDQPKAGRHPGLQIFSPLRLRPRRREAMAELLLRSTTKEKHGKAMATRGWGKVN